MLGERIKKLRERMGISQTELARMVGGGVKQQNIAQFEDGTVRQPRYLPKLLKVLGVSDPYGELIEDENDAIAYEQLKKIPTSQFAVVESPPPGYEVTRKPDTVKIQHLSAAGGMGSMLSIDVDHDSEITTIELTKQYLSSRLGNITRPANLKIMSGIGDSMRPTFQSGDTLFVDIGVNEFVTEATYVIHFDGSLWIKNLARDGNGGYMIMSSNAAYPPVNARKDDPTFKIIGMVVGVLNLNTLV